MIKYILLTAILTASVIYSISQPVLPIIMDRKNTVNADSINSSNTDSSYFKASLNYLTNNVWQGRKNDITQPYLTPTITYTHKSGLYADAGIGYIPYNDAGLDVVMLEGGYDHALGNLFSLSLYGGKYFYSKHSESVRSASGGSLSAGISFTPQNDLFSLGETAGLNFSDKTDYSSLTELSHLFYLGDNGQYSLGPQASMNMGTQNYYSSYVVDLPAKRLKRGRRTITTIVSNTVMGASKFQILDYEFSCPVSYAAKKWLFSITPFYVIPEGAVSYKTTPGNKVTTENLTQSFFAQAEANIRF